LNPVDRRTYGAFLYLLSAVALGPVTFALLLTGWLAALLLAVTPASVPVLVGFRWAVRQVALAEAWLARELLGERTGLAPMPARGRGFWAAGKAVLADPAFWRQQVFLVLRMIGGSAIAIGEASLLAAGGFTSRASSASCGCARTTPTHRRVLAVLAYLQQRD
jgi:Putative sensor